MKVDKTLISKLEDLSRLELSDKERMLIIDDLNAILEMVEKLNELDTSGVEPLIHITEGANIFRDDNVRDQLERGAALRNAPLHDEQYFKVPKVINLRSNEKK